MIRSLRLQAHVAFPPNRLLLLPDPVVVMNTHPASGRLLQLTHIRNRSNHAVNRFFSSLVDHFESIPKIGESDTARKQSERCLYTRAFAQQLPEKSANVSRNESGTALVCYFVDEQLLLEWGICCYNDLCKLLTIAGTNLPPTE